MSHSQDHMASLQYDQDHPTLYTPALDPTIVREAHGRLGLRKRTTKASTLHNAGSDSGNHSSDGSDDEDEDNDSEDIHEDGDEQDVFSDDVNAKQNTCRSKLV